MIRFLMVCMMAVMFVASAHAEEWKVSCSMGLCTAEYQGIQLQWRGDEQKGALTAASGLPVSKDELDKAATDILNGIVALTDAEKAEETKGADYVVPFVGWLAEMNYGFDPTIGKYYSAVDEIMESAKDGSKAQLIEQFFADFYTTQINSIQLHKPVNDINRQYAVIKWFVLKRLLPEQNTAPYSEVAQMLSAAKTRNKDSYDAMMKEYEADTETLRQMLEPDMTVAKLLKQGDTFRTAALAKWVTDTRVEGIDNATVMELSDMYMVTLTYTQAGALDDNLTAEFDNAVKANDTSINKVMVKGTLNKGGYLTPVLVLAGLGILFIFIRRRKKKSAEAPATQAEATQPEAKAEVAESEAKAETAEPAEEPAQADSAEAEEKKD